MSTSPSRLPYFPALDGLRGVAVAAVLVFHAGFGWAVGGYLGVSTFFTLSGFLITALLLRERQSTGGIALRRFWSRRFRRLMPAALITLGLAVLFGATVADPAQLRGLRADVLSALGYVANWRFVLADQSYADLFSLPSPVLHFWSLAIEEQFYLLFPLLTLGLLRVTRNSRRWLGVAFALLVLASLALARFFELSDDRIYYGTDTRAGELLIGALLAVVVSGRDLRPAMRAVAATTGAAALGVTLVLYGITDQSSAWLYEGGLTAFGLLTAAVILAAIQPRGPVPALLGLRPLVALGRISYGVYLYHWLVFLWLTPERTGLDPWPLFGLRLLVTLAAAAASYHLVELPIRRGRLVTDRQALVAGPVAAGAVAVSLVLVTASPPAPPVDFDAAQSALEEIEITPVTAGTAGRTDEVGVEADNPPEPPPPRIAVFGDSTALMTALGVERWIDESGLAVQAGGSSWLGCGIGRGGERRTLPGERSDAPEGCNDWATTWADAVDEGRPDLAVVQVGPWEVTDRRLAGDETWRAPGDPVYDDYLVSEMVEATDVLSAHGAEVVWLTSPAVGVGESGREIERRGAAADPARMERLNELMAEAVEQRPDDAHLLDLAGYVASTGEDVRLRPDGIHFAEETAAEVTREWLGPELVQLHERTWIDDYIAEHGPPIPEPLRTLVVGDSTAMLLGFGLNEHARETGDLTMASLAELGCGISRDGERDYHGGTEEVPQKCRDLWDEWLRALEEFDPHVVVVLTGPFDVADRRLPGDEHWRAPGDPVYDRYLLDELRAAAEHLTSTGSLVVWLTSPRIDVGRGDVPPPPEPYPASDPARMERLNELIARVDREYDAVVRADYAGHLAGYPAGELDPEMRPDGVHLANEEAPLVGAWLGPELQRLYGDWALERWRSNLGTPAPRDPGPSTP